MHVPVLLSVFSFAQGPVAGCAPALIGPTHPLVVTVAGTLVVAACAWAVAVRSRRARHAPARRRTRAAPSVATQAVKESLLLLMQTSRPHRNPDLRVSDLAGAIHVPTHVVSAVLNREFGLNFSDFVNRYRTREAEQLLLDPERRQFTILSIALEVGFASKASFNRAFKKHTGLTPSEYQRRAMNGESHSG